MTYEVGVMELARKVQVIRMAFEDAQVLICPDGTFVFNARAVKALRLHHAHAISVCYSSAYEGFALQSIKANGGQPGMPLEKKGSLMICLGAADFLVGEGILPAKPTRYDAQYYADLNTIVVRNVAVKNRRKAA